jgi:sortase A
MKTKLVIVLLVVAAWLGGRGAYIYLKAGAAQVLLRRAWASTQAGDTSSRPWPWADTSPVGRLRVPALGIDQIVLSGTTGRTLAFGPGLVDGTDQPGHCGNCVVSGHRDTHFRFLQGLELGHEIILESADGATQSFEVTALRVVD